MLVVMFTTSKAPELSLKGTKAIDLQIMQIMGPKNNAKCEATLCAQHFFQAILSLRHIVLRDIVMATFSMGTIAVIVH